MEEKNKSILEYMYSSKSYREERKDKIGDLEIYGKKNIFVRLLLWLSSKRKRGFIVIIE